MKLPLFHRYLSATYRVAVAVSGFSTKASTASAAPPLSFAPGRVPTGVAATRPAASVPLL